MGLKLFLLSLLSINAFAEMPEACKEYHRILHEKRNKLAQETKNIWPVVEGDRQELKKLYTKPIVPSFTERAKSYLKFYNALPSASSDAIEYRKLYKDWYYDTAIPIAELAISQFQDIPKEVFTCTTLGDSITCQADSRIITHSAYFKAGHTVADVCASRITLTQSFGLVTVTYCFSQDFTSKAVTEFPAKGITPLFKEEKSYVTTQGYKEEIDELRMTSVVLGAQTACKKEAHLWGGIPTFKSDEEKRHLAAQKPRGFSSRKKKPRYSTLRILN